MQTRPFLAQQLKTTAELIQWAISLVPGDRLLEVAPHAEHPRAPSWVGSYFGQWSALQHLFHLTYYEEKYALPTMLHWLGEPHPAGDIIFPDAEAEQACWATERDQGSSVAGLLKRFWSARREQIGVLQRVDEQQWKTEHVRTGYGMVSLEFTVSKTIQHTLDHGNTILRHALYWDRMLRHLDREG